MWSLGWVQALGRLTNQVFRQTITPKTHPSHWALSVACHPRASNPTPCRAPTCPRAQCNFEVQGAGGGG